MAKDGRVPSCGTDLHLGWKSLAQERNREIGEEKTNLQAKLCHTDAYGPMPCRPPIPARRAMLREM
jgi:hypothetical protein